MADVFSILSANYKTVGLAVQSEIELRVEVELAKAAQF